MTREAENAVKWPQAKEHLEPPEAGRGTGRFSPTAVRGPGVCAKHLGPRIVKE